MSIKSTLLALAAVAALGTTALMATTSSADAKSFHKGGGHHGGVHFKGGHGKHFGYGHHVHRHAHRHWRHRHVHVYPRPVIYSAAPAVYAAKPAVNPCTCLTKEYTPEGALLFKDICTNEAAINPPPAAAPQQTGMYQPDPSVAPTPAPQR